MGSNMRERPQHHPAHNWAAAEHDPMSMWTRTGSPLPSSTLLYCDHHNSYVPTFVRFSVSLFYYIISSGSGRLRNVMPHSEERFHHPVKAGWRSEGRSGGEGRRWKLAVIAVTQQYLLQLKCISLEEITKDQVHRHPP